MMLKFIARIVGRHKLALLEFYPFVQKYIHVSYLIYYVEFGILYITEVWPLWYMLSATSTRRCKFACGSSWSMSWWGRVCLWIFARSIFITHSIFLQILILQYIITNSAFQLNQAFIWMYVPPYAVKSLFKQIVNQFVLACSQPEVNFVCHLSH